MGSLFSCPEMNRLFSCPEQEEAARHLPERIRQRSIRYLRALRNFKESLAKTQGIVYDGLVNFEIVLVKT